MSQSFIILPYHSNIRYQFIIRLLHEQWEGRMRSVVFYIVLGKKPDDRGGGGGTPLYRLYGDVPLDRVWFLASLP